MLFSIFLVFSHMSGICVWRDIIGNVFILRLQMLFTALHVMQTRYCDEISVRLSVRLSHA